MSQLEVCQRLYVRLQRVCSGASGELQKQLGSDFRRFHEAGKQWKRLMGAIAAKPLIAGLTAEKEGQIPLGKSLANMRRSLETIGRCISTYLDTKRHAFPRLYLIDDTTLLALLSTFGAREPHFHALSEYVTRIFPSIAGVRAVFESATVPTPPSPQRAPPRTVGEERDGGSWRRRASSARSLASMPWSVAMARSSRSTVGRLSAASSQPRSGFAHCLMDFETRSCTDCLRWSQRRA